MVNASQASCCCQRAFHLYERLRYTTLGQSSGHITLFKTKYLPMSTGAQCSKRQATPPHRAPPQIHPGPGQPPPTKDGGRRARGPRGSQPSACASRDRSDMGSGVPAPSKGLGVPQVIAPAPRPELNLGPFPDTQTRRRSVSPHGKLVGMAQRILPEREHVAQVGSAWSWSVIPGAGGVHVQHVQFRTSSRARATACPRNQAYPFPGLGSDSPWRPI